MQDVSKPIVKYAEKIRDIIRRGTIGDYTWEGVLFEFYREIQTPSEEDTSYFQPDEPRTPGVVVKVDGLRFYRRGEVSSNPARPWLNESNPLDPAYTWGELSSMGAIQVL